MTVSVILLVVAVVLFILGKQRIISESNFQLLTNVATVVAVLAAIAVFVFPAATSDSKSSELAATPASSVQIPELSTTVQPSSSNGTELMDGSAFQATSEDSTFFAVVGTVSGKYRIDADSILVTVDKGLLRLRYLSDSSYNDDRRIESIAVGLGTYTDEEKNWGIIASSPRERINFTLSIDNQHTLQPITFTIPLNQELDLTRVWLVFIIESTKVNDPSSKIGESYIHSDYVASP
jgi:hypothetical protein